MYKRLWACLALYLNPTKLTVMARKENIRTSSTEVICICFANKNLSAIVKICFGTIVMWGKNYINWEGNWCCGASTGRPCGIGLIHILGVGCCVVRCWVVDDRL